MSMRTAIQVDSSPVLDQSTVCVIQHTICSLFNRDLQISFLSENKPEIEAKPVIFNCYAIISLNRSELFTL